MTQKHNQQNPVWETLQEQMSYKHSLYNKIIIKEKRERGGKRTYKLKKTEETY